MTTTIQIRAEIETAKKFKAIWERLKITDSSTTQGETLETALGLLEDLLDGKVVRIKEPVLTGTRPLYSPDIGRNVDIKI